MGQGAGQGAAGPEGKGQPCHLEGSLKHCREKVTLQHLRTHTHTLPPETAGAVELFSTKFFTFQLHGLSKSLPRQSRALSLSAGSPLTLCAHSLHRTKAQLRVAAVLYHLLNFSKLIKFLKPTALAQGQQPVSPVPGRI